MEPALDLGRSESEEKIEDYKGCVIMLVSAGYHVPWYRAYKDYIYMVNHAVERMVSNVHLTNLQFMTKMELK